jgi:hypothetical protein
VARDQQSADASQDPEVYRITGAVRPHSDDLEQRMGRYLVSMLIRTVCVILVLVVPGPARWVFAVGAVVLPYIAVVMANTGHTRRDSAPPTVSAGTVRQAISRAPAAGARPSPATDAEYLVGQVVPPAPAASPQQAEPVSPVVPSTAPADAQGRRDVA